MGVSGLRQDDGGRAGRRRARLALHRGRRPAPARQHREDAPRRAADGWLLRALARPHRRRDRRPARRRTRRGGRLLALRRAYRDVLIGPRDGVALVYLAGGHDLIAARLHARHGHFMPESLLDSQFAALEPPGADEHAIVVPIGAAPRDAAAAVLAALVAREAATHDTR